MHADCNIKKAKIALIGASGKVGRVLSKLIQEDQELELSDQGDVVIDFSTPEGTRKAIAMRKPLVCGTTGLSQEIFLELEQLSRHVPVVYSPNFSIGMTLSFEIGAFLGQKLKKLRSLGFHPDVSIKETHHKQKKDSPSGSALKLSQLVGTQAIESERVEDVFGLHQLTLSLDDERLFMQHEMLSRKPFAKGALLAAKFILNKPPKFYSFSEVLG